jgi:hypothetical protein
MNDTEKLKAARDILLRLHKAMLDFEREAYERMHGKLNAGQFLNVILEDKNFEWLRKFSMLIVEIDELFDLNDGISSTMIELNLEKIAALVTMKDEDEYFRAKYQNAIQMDLDSASFQGELRTLLDT